MSDSYRRHIGPFSASMLIAGSMIGSGVFNLPQNMAESSGALAIIIAWTITAIGMLCLAKVFQQLALRRPDINTGRYGYAREGFGDYVGFNTAWGMWISAMAGNAGYMVMFFAGLGGFSIFSFFGDGSTTAATFSIEDSRPSTRQIKINGIGQSCAGSSCS